MPFASLSVFAPPLVDDFLNGALQQRGYVFGHEISSKAVNYPEILFDVFLRAPHPKYKR